MFHCEMGLTLVCFCSCLWLIDHFYWCFRDLSYVKQKQSLRSQNFNKEFSEELLWLPLFKMLEMVVMTPGMKYWQLLRVKIACVQSHQHHLWFEDNLGETYEKWSRTCLHTVNHYDAILTWNSTWTVERTLMQFSNQIYYCQFWLYQLMTLIFTQSMCGWGGVCWLLFTKE